MHKYIKWLLITINILIAFTLTAEKIQKTETKYKKH